MKRQDVLDIAKSLHAKTYKQGDDWNGMKVYIPVYSRFKKAPIIGFPHVIFEDNGMLRLSTEDEALEYIAFELEENDK